MEAFLVRKEKYVIYWIFLGCFDEKFIKAIYDVFNFWF